MRIPIFIFILMYVAGCAPAAVQKEEVFLQARQIKAAVPSVPAPVRAIQSDALLITRIVKKSPLIDKEKLVYKAKYMGISIGEFVIVNKGLSDLNGRPAYRFELTVRTLPFFGQVKDLYVSYMDAETLAVLRHEEYLKGGTLESSVDFDHTRHIAVYTNAVNGTRREVAIPDHVHDIATGGFYLRMVPLGLGDTTEFNIYADEKVYNYVGLLHSQVPVTLPRRVRQEAYLLKSFLFHNGKPVNSVSAEVLFSTDSYRKPLRAVLKTFLGGVAVTLEP